MIPSDTPRLFRLRGVEEGGKKRELVDFLGLAGKEEPRSISLRAGRGDDLKGGGERKSSRRDYQSNCWRQMFKAARGSEDVS